MTNPPTISALDQAAAAFRVALLARDEAALKRLMAAYNPVYQRMQVWIDALLAQIAKAEAEGTIVRPSWLRERGRLETLQRQIVGEWARYADVAEQAITEAQRAAVAAAHTEAHQLTLAALHDAGVTVGADVARLPLEALQNLVGVLGDGSPLRTLLDALGVQAAQQIGDTLTHAIAVGRNPRQTARDIRASLGGNLNRALTIARTEQMRAYRNASLRNYQANSDLLRGWRWLASPSRRTCPVCLAMDGTEHPLDTPFATHPCCRCTMVPVLHNAPAVDPKTTGAAWFAQQPAEVQRAMLGPGKHALYADGKLTLADLAEVRQDVRWGPTLRQRSLGELRAGGRAAQAVPVPYSLGAAVDPRAQLRALRVNQLSAMSDTELRAEVEVAQQARWRDTKLLEHTKKHQADFMAVFGQPLGPSAVREMSVLVMHSFDHVFTGIGHDGEIDYVFVSRWKQGDATIVLAGTRGGLIRTFFPSPDLSQYLARHSHLIEVTQRVHSTS